MKARSRLVLAFTSASIFATMSPVSPETRSLPTVVPVAFANTCSDLSSAALAASEYSFCESIPTDPPLRLFAWSSSSWGTPTLTFGADGVASHAVRPSTPSARIPRNLRLDQSVFPAMTHSSLASDRADAYRRGDVATAGTARRAPLRVVHATKDAELAR